MDGREGLRRVSLAIGRVASAAGVARLLGDCQGLLSECDGLFSFRLRRFQDVLNSVIRMKNKKYFLKINAIESRKDGEFLRRDGRLSVFSACYLTLSTYENSLLP